MKKGGGTCPKWACWKSVSSRVCSLTKMLIKTNHNHHNRYNPTHPISSQKSASSHPHPICCCHLSPKKNGNSKVSLASNHSSQKDSGKATCALQAELVRNKGNIWIHSHNFPIVGMSQYLLLYIYDLYIFVLIISVYIYIYRVFLYIRFHWSHFRLASTPSLLWSPCLSTANPRWPTTK